jgi:hypothetical protein
MSVFISWSGRASHSHKVATLLKDWLPKVLQKLPCFLSSHDIEAGAAWIKVLFDRLEESNVGLICLTRSTLNKPWILFEAGALAKKIEAARVCPVLIDLNPSDVEFPLAAFQLKTVAREDVHSLVTMINSSRGALALSDEELREVFDVRWPQFEERLNKILKEPEAGMQPAARRSDSDLLEEILSLTRGMASQLPASKTEVRREQTEKRQFRANSALAAKIWNHVLDQTREKRRLLLAWMENVSSVDFSEDNQLFQAWFEDEGPYEAVKVPRTTAYVQGLINEIAPKAKLEWDYIPF